MTDIEITEAVETRGYRLVAIKRGATTVVRFRCPCGRIERAETAGVFDPLRFTRALDAHTAALAKR